MIRVERGQGTSARAKEALEEGTVLLRVEGTRATVPDRHTIQVGEGIHLRPDGRPWGFLNHSCDPNCRIDFESWTLVAARRIEGGEQLTFNYLTTEWDLSSPFRCGCGAEACEGWIRGLRHLPSSRRQALAPECSPYLRDCLSSLDPSGPDGEAGYLREWNPEVHVFLPCIRAEGGMLSTEYDTPAYRSEVAGWFEALNLPFHWVPLTLDNLEGTIEKVRVRHRVGVCVVLNLCDGDEFDGWPGASVVRALEDAGLPYTGASVTFYETTTWKTRTKELLVAAGVPTPRYLPILGPGDVARVGAVVGYPAMIKPDVSAGSFGISLRSRVVDEAGALAQVHRLRETWGADTGKSAVFAERFVDGPEFTVLLVADPDRRRGLRVFPAARRVFHPALPSHERFLSFDRYWSLFREESRPPEGEPFYRYDLASADLQERLLRLAERAYRAVHGTGYARVDIRMEEATGELFVLEVNSNCGISGDRQTSVGEILHLTGTPVQHLIFSILRDGYERSLRRPGPEAD